MTALVNKANELGVTQGDAAAAIAKTAEEVDKLAMEWGAFKTQLVGDVAPALGQFLETVRQAREGVNNRRTSSFDQYGRAIGTTMVTTLNTVNPFMSQDTVSQAMIQDTITRQVGLAPGIVERTEARQKELELQRQANEQLQRLNDNLERNQTQRDAIN